MAESDEVMHVRRQLRLGPRASSEARNALGPLEGELRPELLRDMRLLVSELVTNSFRHARLAPGEPITMDVTVRPDCIHVEVEDRGEGFPGSWDPGATETRESGWGLMIVDAVADRWGVDGNGSTVVWFELAIPRSPRPEAARPGR